MLICRASNGWTRLIPVGKVSMGKRVALLANTNFEKQQSKQYPQFQSYEEYCAWEDEQLKENV